MKKLLVGCLISVVILIVAVVIAIFSMPKTYEVKRDISIRGSAADIYAYIGHLDRWPEWTAWNTEKYPTLQYDEFKVTQGPGAVMAWTMDGGRGELTITDASPDTGIAYDLAFDTYLSKGDIRLDPKDGSTTVTWRNYGDLEGIGVLFGPFMEMMMAPDFETGLSRLKERVEAKQ